MACAILERISGLKPSSETTAPRYLEACYSTQLLPFHLYHSLYAIGPIYHQFGLLGTLALIFILYLVQVLSRLSTRASSSYSSSARAYMSSANCRFMIFLPPMLIFLIPLGGSHPRRSQRPGWKNSLSQWPCVRDPGKPYSNLGFQLWST